MAIGQITLTDLNDTRNGNLSLDSNYPRIQTYDPNKKEYSPNYELENSHVVITPQLMLGNDVIIVNSNNITYTITSPNGNISVSSAAGEGVQFWTEEKTIDGGKTKVLCIARNLEIEYYHIEAVVSGMNDNGTPLPDFTASYDITLLTNGSKISEITLKDLNNGLLIKREDGTFEPKTITLNADISNFDFGDNEIVYYYFYKDDKQIGNEGFLIVKDAPTLLTYKFSATEDSAASYSIIIFDSTKKIELGSAYTSINLLQDGVSGENAYTLSIDDNRPVILCNEEEGIYTAIESGEDNCGIILLDGNQQVIPINRVVLVGYGGGAQTINEITFDPSILNGKVNIKITWTGDTVIKKTTVKYNLTFGNGSVLTASITVLPLTGGKNGEDGKDAVLLVLEPDPNDQFTSSSTGPITIYPYFYVGGQLYEKGDNSLIEPKLTYKWTTPGVEEILSTFSYYQVDKDSVETLQTYICTIEYEGVSYSNRITIKNTLYPYYCEITSSKGNTFKNGKVNTELKCTVYRVEEGELGGQVLPFNIKYVWYTLDEKGNEKYLRDENHSDAGSATFNYSGTIEGTQAIYCDVLF